MIDKIKERAGFYEEEIIRIRRELHQYPEVSWQEVQTTTKIAEELEKIGIPILQKGFKGTESGLLAELDSGKPGPTLALRADIDALAMQEETDVEFKSHIDGKMHSCGHDSHAAMLLGAAMILKDLKEFWTGKVRFLFQPSEEAYPSGARAMIAENALEGVKEIFGIHIFGAREKGKIFYRSGPMMAASDTWKAEIIGAGGHGATPERTIDPTIAAAQFISGVQTVVSRELSALDMGVVTVGGIQTSSYVNNIIPEKVSLIGGCRSFTPEKRKQIEESVKRIFFGACETYRCKGTIEWVETMPATITDPGVTERMRLVASQLVGPDRVEETHLNTGSEDFGDYLKLIPGTFMMLGARNEEIGAIYSQHSPKFKIDESVMKIGSSLHAAFVIFSE